MSSGLFFQIQSTIILLIFFFGIYVILKQKNRFFHAKIMSTAIIWDLLLIVQIEVNRTAIAKAIKVPSNPLILNIHVALALSSVFLYMVMIYTGRRILKGSGTLINRHRFFGRATLIFRILTYITSFWAV